MKREFIAAPAPAGESGEAEVTFVTPSAGGFVAVYVWAVDIAGNHSNRAVFDFFVRREDPPPPPEAESIARWPLTLGDTRDTVGDNDLHLFGTEGADYEWADGRACLPESSLAFHGSIDGYAATTEAVIATDEPISVAAWVVPGGPAGEDQTILSQGAPSARRCCCSRPLRRAGGSRCHTSARSDRGAWLKPRQGP